MAVATTQSTDSIVTDLPAVEPEIDVIDLDELTDQQRRIIMAASEGYENVSELANRLCTQRSSVVDALMRVYDRHDVKFDERYNNGKNYSNFEYDDLTDTRQEIIDFLARNPSASLSTIAEHVGCSLPYVDQTLVYFPDLVDERRRELNPAAAIRDELFEIRDRIDELLVELA